MWELDYKESWALKNRCFWTVVLEKTLESPLDCKEIQPVHPKGNPSWVFIGRNDTEAETPNTLATWYEELTHLKRPWCWERLKAGRKGDDRGWDGWMASPTQWTGVWVNSASWWWSGRSGMLQSMGSQRVGHDWVTELNWIMSDVEHFFHVFVGHLYVFLGEMSFRSSAQFLIELFVFLILSFISCLHILEINPLSVASFAIIFSHSEGFLLILFIVSFSCKSF